MFSSEVKSMRYWKVDAKCGHVRRSKYIIKSFHVQAENGSIAADIVRWKPRVKHHAKDAIQKVVEITKEEYEAGLRVQIEDPYFKARNVQEQREKCIGIDYETFYEDKPECNYKKTHAKRHLIQKQLDMEWKKGRSKRIYEQD